MNDHNAPLVSVIIPCYNQAQYLSDALDSLLLQTYQNWEALVVNDGSSDKTEEVALYYINKEPKIRYVSKENGGLSSARNIGAKLAQGEYLLPLDADDIIKPEYMEMAIEAFVENPGLKLVYCQGYLFGLKSGLWEEVSYKGYKNLLLGISSIFCSAFFRKSDWEKIGGYDENMCKGHEDWEFFIRLLEGEGLVYQIPLPLFYYRVKQSSMITMANKRETKAETSFYMYSKNRNIYSHYFDDDILNILYELNNFREQKAKHKNKWYRRLYHKLMKG